MYIKQTDVNSPLAPFWPWVADFLNPTNRTMPVDRLRRPTHGLVRLRAGSVWVPLANDRLDHHDAQEEGERSTSGQQRCTRQYKKNKHDVRTQPHPEQTACFEQILTETNQGGCIMGNVVVVIVRDGCFRCLLYQTVQAVCFCLCLLCATTSKTPETTQTTETTATATATASHRRHWQGTWNPTQGIRSTGGTFDIFHKINCFQITFPFVGISFRVQICGRDRCCFTHVFHFDVGDPHPMLLTQPTEDVFAISFYD